MVESYFPNTVSRDLYSLCVGKEIGYGVHRKVFEWLPDPSLVVKFEVGGQSFANIIEWETWNRVKDVIDVHHWFAPCVSISSCGSVLLQKKASPVSLDELPKLLPAYLSDTKRTNFGRIGKRVVCIDYGSHAMFENGMTKRMRKVNWYDC
jgi:hypothetical protein